MSPNLWAGVGLVRGGAGTALVGDPQTVAARMREYAELGIETFILSGYPHLEEAYRAAELLFPLLPIEKRKSPLQHNITGPFGEMIDFFGSGVGKLIVPLFVIPGAPREIAESCEALKTRLDRGAPPAD